MLNKQEILERVTEEQIFERYLHLRVKLRKRYKSPFRVDNSPSCQFHRSRGGKLYFIDYSRGESWDCFKAVQEMYRCSFYEALKVINQDFGLLLDTKNPKKVKAVALQQFITAVTHSESIKLDVIPCEWTDRHYEYWEQYGITPETLELFKVVPISGIIVGYKVTDLHDEIAFAYCEHLPYIKIYRPFADKRSKWRNTVPKDYLHGEKSIPEPPDIITKSLKDVMVLWEFGINAVALMSEGIGLHRVNEWPDDIKPRFSLMDNDKAGKEAAEKMSLYGYKSFFMLEEDGKDLSDVVKNKGLDYAKKYVLECMKQT